MSSSKQSAPQTVPVSSDLVGKMLKVTALYNRWVQSCIRPDGLAPARMQLMHAIITHPGTTMSELKERRGTSAANISKLIDGLVDDGLLQRQPDPEDRRVVRLYATTEGTNLVAEEWEKFQREISTIFERMSPHDQYALQQGVNELLRAFGDDGSTC